MNNLPRVFVSNIAFSTTWMALKEHFSKVGAVKFVKIFEDRETKRPRGTGYVTFESPEAAKKAVETLNGTELEGRNIVVREYIERPPKTTSEQE
ncbi:hypothetical protein FDP41_007416 [Naegleria fowleri]|uniref:RRM domain-containing protein n=1 Tax=Naegleria fowleri TaxID=5763 RepID=A0A6A5CG22_NAEFO|nr:uncharacterized protein FDP41_007416 [Naegleria fowleri]KAF0984239.1 hypothetical protein FDP41_007416 [Naegleria fowleri]CAG4709218.1 unnamed protein product [Naegleria fowleri]